MRKTFYIISSFILIAAFSIYADQIAITFDDLPSSDDDKSITEQMQISDKIISSLQKENAPAIGFVNESQLYDNIADTSKKIEILKSWISHGYSLGNHTYSHIYFSNTVNDEYFADIAKGSIVSAELMQKAARPYKYFRHPYLDTGNSKEKKESLDNYLSKNGYVVAPVTINTDDWKFNEELTKNPSHSVEIIDKYLEYTKLKFIFAQEAAKKMFGRNIKHVWLLHYNYINSCTMTKLLEIAKNLGYEFITIEDALTDQVYQELDNYYEPYGVTWLFRWDHSKNQVIDWEADTSALDSGFIFFD